MRFLAMLIATVAVLMMSGPRVAHSDAYQDLTKVMEEYETLLTEHERLTEAKSKLIRPGFDPYTGGKKEAVLKKDREIKAVEERIAATRPKYNAAMKSWQEAMRPYYELETFARGVAGQISAMQNVSEVNKQRAVDLIYRDLTRLIPNSFSELSLQLDTVEKMLRAGRPLKDIEKRLAEMAKNDPATSIVLGEVSSNLSKALGNLKGAERVAAYNKWMKRLSLVAKTSSSLQREYTDPRKSAELQMLSDLVSLTADLVPVKAVSWQLKTQKYMIDEIQDSVGAIIDSAIRLNLVTLQDRLQSYKHERGDDWGLNTSTLFSRPDPRQIIIPIATTFRPSEPITGQYFSSIHYDSDAWIGVVPSFVKHGDEETGDLNDLKYTRIGNAKDNGVFALNVTLDPGEYDLRMYDDDDNGKEVFSVTIRIDSSKPADPVFDLTGVWVSHDYDCERPGITEKVEVEHKDKIILGRKLTGDPCVPAGNTTFVRGEDGILWCKVGTPENPASSSQRGSLAVASRDLFSACGMSFERVK